MRSLMVSRNWSRFVMSVAVIGTFSLNAADFVWQGSSGGNWSETANWQGGEVPNAADAVADLSAASGTYAISIDSPITVGKIVLADGATTDLTLSGQKLTFAATEKPELFVGTARTFRLTTSSTGGNQGLRKTGSGTFLPTITSAGNTFGGGLTIEAGTVQTVKNGANNHWCGSVDVRSGATFSVAEGDTLSSSFKLGANGGTVDFKGIIDYVGAYSFSNGGLYKGTNLAFIDDLNAVAKITATGTGHAGTINTYFGVTSRYADSKTKVSPYRTLNISVADGADLAMTGQIVDNRLQAKSYGNNIFHSESASDYPYAGQIQKVGAGDLVLYDEDISLTGPTMIDAGRLILSNKVTMTASSIRLATGVDQLILRAGSTLKIGGIACSVPGELDLGGNAVDVGGTAADSAFAGSIKNGTIRKVGYNTQAVASLGQSSVDVLGGTLAIGFPQPLVRYAFDDAANLGKDSGTLGKTLTVPETGVAWASDGKSGGCANLSGKYFTAASAAGLPGGNSACTLAAWIKPTGLGGVIAWGNPVSGKHYYNGLLFNGAKQLKHTFWGGYDAISAAQSFAFADGNWHHVAFTYEPNTRLETFYVDGVAAGTTNYSAAVDVVTTNTFYVGSGIYAGTFKGKMDEVMVFDRCLAASEIVRVRDWNSPITTAGLADGASIRLERDATLSLHGTKESLSSIAGVGTLALADAEEVTVASENATSIGRLTGTGTLIKSGSGTMTLNRAAGMSGTLDVRSGAISAVAPNTDASLKKHLKAWWNFNDRNDPGADASGNGLTVRSYYVPGTGNSSGETYPWRNRFETLGGAAWFDGVSNHHLELVNSNDVAKLPHGSSSFTTACWFNPAADCPTQGGLIYWGNGVCVSPTASRKCNGIRFASATKMFHFFWSADLTTSDLGDIRSGDVPDGWHHIAVTYDSDTGKRTIYYDGEAKANDTQTGINVDASEFRIGMTLGYQRAYQNFKGYMDDVMIFDTALTAAQVKSIMRGLADEPTSGCDVKLASGTSFAANEGAVGIGTLSGAGSVTIAEGASLVVGGTLGSDFTGTLSGAGSLGVSPQGELQCVGGTSRSLSGLELAEGATLSVSGTSSDTACWLVSGDVALPTKANVKLSLAENELELRVKLFETSGDLTGSVAGWNTTFTIAGRAKQPKWEVSTYIEGKAVYARVRAPGLFIYLK